MKIDQIIRTDLINLPNPNLLNPHLLNPHLLNPPNLPNSNLLNPSNSNRTQSPPKQSSAFVPPNPMELLNMRKALKRVLE